MKIQWKLRLAVLLLVLLLVCTERILNAQNRAENIMVEIDKPIVVAINSKPSISSDDFLMP